MATPTTPAKTTSTTLSAVVVVLVIAAVAALVIVVHAFSTSETPMSIDGTTATTSQHLD